MKKDLFRKLFLTSIEHAVCNVEENIKKKIQRNYMIHLVSFGFNDVLLKIDEAMELIYINENEFYAFIDISAEKITDQKIVIRVRVSGHEPCSYQYTCNPSGLGPFKQLLPNEIEVLGKVHTFKYPKFKYKY